MHSYHCKQVIRDDVIFHKLKSATLFDLIEKVKTLILNSVHRIEDF